jgi:hypothetical protein
MSRLFPHSCNFGTSLIHIQNNWKSLFVTFLILDWIKAANVWMSLQFRFDLAQFSVRLVVSMWRLREQCYKMRAQTETNKYNFSYIKLYGLLASVDTCFAHCISKSDWTPLPLCISPKVSIVYISLFISPARMNTFYCQSIKCRHNKLLNSVWKYITEGSVSLSWYEYSCVTVLSLYGHFNDLLMNIILKRSWHGPVFDFAPQYDIPIE